MHKIFYNRKEKGDILFIKYEDDISTKEVKSDNVIAYYKGDTLVEVHIVDFSKICRLFHEGEIIDPPSEFISLVNHILINANLKPLSEDK